RYVLTARDPAAAEDYRWHQTVGASRQGGTLGQKPLALRRFWRGAHGAVTAALLGCHAVPSSDARASSMIRPGWNMIRKRPTAARRVTAPRSGRKKTCSLYSPISLTAKA